MRLSRLTMSFPVLALTIACHDFTGPAPERISEVLMLASVNGQPLPAVLFTEPTRTRTVVFSSLLLNMEGHAFISERDKVDAQGTVTESIITATLEYRLHGDQIEIGSFTPCPPNALCAANATGTLSNGTLTLNHPLPAPGKVYFYQRGLLL